MKKAVDTIKLTDAELTVMQIIWQHEKINAVELSGILEKTNWKKSTTYIVLSRLEAKGAIRRDYPKYCITALVTKEQIQIGKTAEFINKIFEGRTENAFACFLKNSDISENDLDTIQKMIDEKKNQKK